MLNYYINGRSCLACMHKTASRKGGWRGKRLLV